MDYSIILSVILCAVICQLKASHGAFMGHAIVPRGYQDSFMGHRVIVPGYGKYFPENGKVKQFEYYNTKSGRVRFQVWRYMNSNEGTGVQTVRLIGQTDEVTTPAPPAAIRKHSIEDNPMEVKEGDILGIEYLDTNPVPYDDTNCVAPSIAMFTDRHNEDIPLRVGQNYNFQRFPSAETHKCRQYSLGATVTYASEECQELTAIIGQEGVLTSTPDYDGQKKYGNNMKKCWTITAPEDHIVRLNVTNFVLELATSSGTCYDYVEVRDGPTVASPQVKKWCGIGIPSPNPMFSSDDSLFVSFVTDGANSMAGFRMLYTAIVPGSNPIEPLPIASSTPMPTQPTDKPNAGNNTGLQPTDSPTNKGESSKTAMYVGIAIGVLALIAIILGVILGVMYTQGYFKRKPRPGEEDAVKRISSANGRPYTASRRPQTAMQRPKSGVSEGSIPDIPASKDPGSIESDENDDSDENGSPMQSARRPKTPKGPPPSHLPPIDYPRAVTPSAPPPSHLPPLETPANEEYAHEGGMAGKKKMKRKKRVRHEMDNQAYDSADDDTARGPGRQYPASPPPAYSD